jgi:hypothetical protein
MSFHPSEQIAEKYGQFSGELFQAMLGLDIIEEDCNTKSVASKLGKPVKSMANLLEHSTSVGDLPTLHEESATEGEHAATKPTTSTNLEFEVDDDLLAEEEDAESDFIAPNACLVRSMCRCERRLYPLLKEWTPVDVVITDYEIVYFDVESDSNNNLSPELRKKKEALRVALQATKGHHCHRNRRRWDCRAWIIGAVGVHPQFRPRPRTSPESLRNKKNCRRLHPPYSW